ncbi:pyridoxamine 5'-phosphate oxidase family protein [Candidatus Zixiibacteriota bacterium]
MPKYHMHKKEREIADRSKLLEVLIRGRYAAVALCRKDEPYIVTLNYGYDQEKNCLYFHSAQRGLKIDFLAANEQACATVVEDLGYADGQCTHKYRSIILRGEMGLVQDLEEKKHGMSILIRHQESVPENMEKKLRATEDAYRRVAVLRLNISEITGKENP